MTEDTGAARQNKKKKTPSELHAGHRERLREKFMKGGLELLSDHEVVELLLYYCIPRRDTNALAHSILDDFGSIVSLLEADAQTIARNCGLSMNTAMLFTLILPLMKRYETAKWDKNEVLDSSQKACEYAGSLFVGETDEVMQMICLDTKNRVICPVEISRGTIDKAPVYPRVIMETVLKYGAASVILSHNHPSGSLIPSHSDLRTTTYIVGILEKIEVKVVDHIIVGGKGTLSFAEKNIMHFST